MPGEFCERNRRAVQAAVFAGSSTGGFTLIELLVVLAIIGLLAAIVPFSYERLREAAEFQNTVRTIATDLSTARREARSIGKGVAFSVDLRARQYGVDGHRPRALPAGIQINVTVADTELVNRVARIRFYPDGNATGGSVDVIRPSGTGVRLTADWLDGRVALSALP